MRVKSTNSGVPAHWLLDALAEKGLHSKSVFSHLGLPEDDLLVQGVPLATNIYNRIFEWAALELNDPALGIHIAQKIDPTQFGLLGYIAGNAPSLEAWALYLERYHCIFTSAFSFSFVRQADRCRFVYEEGNSGSEACAQDIDRSLALSVQKVRGAISANWTPDSCYFKYSAPPNLEEHRRQFGNQLYFDQAYNAIEFPTAIIACPIRDADPNLLQIMMSQANVILDETVSERDLINHIRSILAANLGYRTLNSDSIARLLHMSTRSLNRQLNSLGTSFQLLRDQIILESSKKALLETTNSVTEIGLALGFSETSSFTRGFKRLAGETPRRFRERAGQPNVQSR